MTNLLTTVSSRIMTPLRFKSFRDFYERCRQVCRMVRRSEGSPIDGYSVYAHAVRDPSTPSIPHRERFQPVVCADLTGKKCLHFNSLCFVLKKWAMSSGPRLTVDITACRQPYPVVYPQFSWTTLNNTGDRRTRQFALRHGEIR